jgi:hypothetical protein
MDEESYGAVGAVSGNQLLDINLLCMSSRMVDI